MLILFLPLRLVFRAPSSSFTSQFEASSCKTDETFRPLLAIVCCLIISSSVVDSRGRAPARAEVWAANIFEGLVLVEEATGGPDAIFAVPGGATDDALLEGLEDCLELERDSAPKRAELADSGPGVRWFSLTEASCMLERRLPAVDCTETVLRVDEASRVAVRGVDLMALRSVVLAALPLVLREERLLVGAGVTIELVAEGGNMRPGMPCPRDACPIFLTFVAEESVGPEGMVAGLSGFEAAQLGVATLRCLPLGGCGNCEAPSESLSAETARADGIRLADLCADAGIGPVVPASIRQEVSILSNLYATA